MSELRYWAVLFVRNGDGSGVVTVTDGDRAPHTEDTVRRIIEVRYGKVDLMGTVGPMTQENAYNYLHSATSTEAGLNSWLAQCK
jgi:hypothetical protein